MKKVLIFSTFSMVSVLTLALLSTSCKKPKELDDGRPRITSVSFVGIPAKNVELDQSRQTITVLLPEVLPEQGLIPNFDTSPGAEIKEGLTPNGKLDISSYCSCLNWDLKKVDYQLSVAYKNKMAGAIMQSFYRLVLIPFGQFPEPIDSQPITYAKFSGSGNSNFIRISLPVKNLYQNPYIKTYFIKNLNTGQEGSINTSLAGFCLNDCEDDLPNRLTFPYDNNPKNLGYLHPGKYQISILTTCDTNRIVFPQPLVIK